jgi:hypothetical protein
VPDLTLDGGESLADLLHAARPVLLDLTGGAVAGRAHDWAARVDIVIGSIDDDKLRAMLIRPDGYVAWATDTFDEDDEHRLHTALRRWFGAVQDSVARMHTVT